MIAKIIVIDYRRVCVYVFCPPPFLENKEKGERGEEK